MYQRLRGRWAQGPRRNSGTFPLSEALLLLFRSVAARLDTGWLNYLARLNKDNTLAVNLVTGKDQDAILVVSPEI